MTNKQKIYAAKLKAMQAPVHPGPVEKRIFEIIGNVNFAVANSLDNAVITAATIFASTYAIIQIVS